MKYFSEYFVEAQNHIAKYKGDHIFQYDKYELTGTHLVKFKKIYSNSKYNQLLVLALRNFDGAIYNLDGEKYIEPKTKRPTLDISETIWKENNDEIILTIDLKNGSILIYNGALLELGKEKIATYGDFGCAMKIEKLTDKKTRYYCNDRDNDDDFNDLIFEIEILD